ncbi:MAG TPA: hypothetical protein V6C46_07800 [Coleofasciculaceae cyanobacterium]
MVESVDFHALYTQLQTRYPSSGLISELVQVQADQYVVRVSIQLGATTLVSGLAAATTVEQAEDLARLRALRLIGVIPLGLVGNSGISMPIYPSPLPPEPVAASPSLVSVPSVNPLPLPEPMGHPGTAIESNFPTPTKLEQLEQEVAVADLTEPVAADQAPEPTVVPEKSEQPKSSRNKGGKVSNQVNLVPLEEEMGSEMQPDAFMEGSYDEEIGFSPEPIDLSELIALTDVEMERVGWSKKRGQTHLKQAYGRQTRAELDEAELLEFLHYLRALPSKV